MISFGLAPSVIVFSLILKSLNINTFSFELPIYQIFLSLLAFLITVFSGLRLAKFNIDTRQTVSFIGLPTPANAIFIASLPIILFYNEDSVFATIIENVYFLELLVVIFSFLLVSEIEMFSLKFKTYNFGENKLRYLFLLISILTIFIFKSISIPIIIIIYIILSVLNSYLLKQK
jgi:CDP-diacylglycerol--serine O-phosphatidyltransferase